MIFDSLLRALARSRHLRDGIALLPPALKSGPLLRGAASLQRRRPEGEDTPIVTNLGISASLRVHLPVDADAVYAFGRPDLHKSERGGLAVARFLASECDSFVDIGSHRGLFVFHVASSLRPPPRILFFEPEPLLFRELAENLNRNRIPSVSGFPVAIGASSGRAAFYVNDDDKLSSSLTNDFAAAHNVHPITVEVLSFRDLATREGLERAFVKVDVEGSEFAFLDGAAGATQRIAYLLIEVLGPAIRAGFVARAEDVLGMNAYYIDELRLRRASRGAFAYVDGQYNWLFAREAPHELRTRLVNSPLTVYD